ncbi:hypothetical protein [Flavobacterium sp.]|uniref:hypothetical protein n=1 Tax=Flavobacterium sp. TaxID=239 RepID=UPI002624668A|nr:hypothetical protein [Flavobacterium sp.]
MKFNLFNRNLKSNKPTVQAVTDTTDYSSNENDFTFVFNDARNTDINCQVISFGDLTTPRLSDTLTIFRNGKPAIKLELRYAYSSSSKLEAIKFHRFVAIGLSGFFYLYDLSTKTVILFIDFNGYFDGFKIAGDNLLVAYNSGIYCFTKHGQIKWHNSNVGLDGIIITNVGEGKIYGSEQIDPPDGWEDFILDLDTGNRTK